MIHAIYFQKALTHNEAIKIVNTTGIPIIYEDKIANYYIIAFNDKNFAKVSNLIELTNFKNICNI
jgi:hypothetical protein